MKSKILVLGVSLAALNAWPVHAQEKTVLDEEITVTTTPQSSGSMTVPGNDDAEIIIKRTPGAVKLVRGSEIDKKFTMSYEDSLSLVPGVSAKKRFGEEVRLSIRGSGLSRGFHMRGIKLTQDGIPFNLADGSGDFQELDPNVTQRIEVYKGGNALQYGGTSLGGAINTVTKTGRSDPGYRINVLGGSYNTYSGNAQAGIAEEKYDLFGSLTGLTSSGFREHEDQKSLKFNSNAGIRLSDDVETRFYISANNLNQELAGSVSRESALHDPTAANPSAVTSDWQRDIRSVRLSNKTSWVFGDDEQLDIGAFVNLKDLFHPITPFVGIIDQESRDVGIFTEFSGSRYFAERKSRYRVGLIGQLGETDAKVYQNINGSRGALTADADQEATDIVLYGENAFYAWPEIALVTGGQITRASRKVTDKTTPSESDSRVYTSLNPKLGLLYEPSEKVQLFANVSHSDEAPTFSELTQGGTVGFTPLDSQKAWTAEIGSRGSAGILSWDISLYRAWLKDEMLQFTTGPGIPATTFNADRTIHQGVELGFDVTVVNNLLNKGDSLVWRNSYTFSDFFFEDDAQYGDNDIPGIAAHFYQTELRYSLEDKWFIAPNIELSSSAYVDYENTIEAPGYMLLNLSAGYNVTDAVSLFIDARNLLNRRYISTFSTIINGAGNTNVYYPGQGRRAFVGLKAKL